ncbi:MAG: helix-hairpin-helix domain-containing protein [Marmoricola sp.]
MRRQTRDQLAETARRRLEQLGEEPAGSDPPAERPPGPVAATGRHARAGEPGARRCVGWLEDRLPDTLRGRVSLDTREVLVVLVAAALGLGLAAVLVLRSTGPGGPVAVPRPRLHPAKPLVTPSTSPASEEGPRREHRRVVVDVAGKVRHPGVVRLPAGSRVIDALRKAGGTRHRVDLTSLNLAQVLTDGQQILVGVKAAAGAGPPTTAVPGATAAPGAAPSVAINSATMEQLESLPGVGPVTAQKIMAWRSAHGSFSSVDELLEIDGIGDKTLADLRPYVTL